MRRREFIAGLGGAVAWPLAARAQQGSMPTVGYLDGGALNTSRETAAEVRRGLSEAGYIEGRNVTTVNREMIAELAARHRLPAVYAHTYFATSGGLVSYGSDGNDLFRRAAEYVDRILRGAKPSDLPVQAPTKFEFAVNLKAAKALGLTVPQSILLRADEVIE
jgi:putative tryptophan/tyrosine transport system substrate-binding protein